MKGSYSVEMLVTTKNSINGQNLLYCILQSGSVCVNVCNFSTRCGYENNILQKPTLAVRGITDKTNYFFIIYMF